MPARAVSAERPSSSPLSTGVPPPLAIPAPSTSPGHLVILTLWLVVIRVGLISVVASRRRRRRHERLFLLVTLHLRFRGESP